MTTNSNSNKLKIFVFAVDGIGHLSACVGACQPLADRGHSITFLINEAFAGQYAKYGFAEIYLTQKPKKVENVENQQETEQNKPKENPVKQIAEMLKETGFFGPKTPLEKLRDQVANPKMYMEQFYEQIVDYNPQFEAIIEKEKPDLFILDTVFFPPAIRSSNVPYANLYSSNPLYLFKSKKLPPFGSGYPADKVDLEAWGEYRALSGKNFDLQSLQYQTKLDKLFNYESKDEVNFGCDEDEIPLIFSPYLNIYGYPEELDYTDIAPRPDNFAVVDAFCRHSPDTFELPEHFARKQGEKLIYVSLGSMGSIDVELMKRIVSALGKTPYKYLVSKGQRGDEYELPANCWGENFLPQMKILPMVDLVITHGGNNTITEAFSHGRLMIVMQLLGDQATNAQRVHEKGYGIRVEPYTFTDDELIGAIEKLLNDKEMQARADKAAQRIAKANSKEKLADRIEEMVAKFKANQQTSV